MPDTAAAPSYPITEVNRVKRVHERGRYDKETVHAILDAALVCHIAYVIDGRPYCTPTGFWREGEHLYWHGSSASRMIRTQGKGVEVCLTVTHFDALVMARSGFHHSINYRAVMAFGTAHIVEDADEKLKLMDRFIDRIYPGRSTLIRQPNKQEFKATTMMGMQIETASAKIRDKHVSDEEEDYEGVPAWSALYPITQVLGEPSDCARQIPGLQRPDDMADFEPGTRFDDLMTKTYAKPSAHDGHRGRRSRLHARHHPGGGDRGPPAFPVEVTAASLRRIATFESLVNAMDQGLVACIRSAEGMTACDYLALRARKHAYCESIHRWFDDWDILLTPSASVAAFPVERLMPEDWPQHEWDWLRWAQFSYPFNIAQNPSISVPAGFTASGLPVGLQITGRRLDDTGVLRAATAFEAAAPWRQHRPAMALA